jgi:hypothetical protein
MAITLDGTAGITAQAINLTTPLPVVGGGTGMTAIQIFHVREEQPAGTHGGASVAGNQVRVLNTIVRNSIVGASLATNQITLPAGGYKIEAYAPAHTVVRHRIRLVNVTDTVVIMLGLSAGTNVDADTHSFIMGTFTLSGTKALNITHFTQSATATLGLGLSTDDTFVNVYTSVLITKIE